MFGLALCGPSLYLSRGEFSQTYKVNTRALNQEMRPQDVRRGDCWFIEHSKTQERDTKIEMPARRHPPLRIPPCTVEVSGM